MTIPLYNNYGKKIFTIGVIQLTLVFIFYISPFIDALTGYLIGNGFFSTNSPFSPSQIFRSVIILLVLYQLKGRQLIYAGLLFSTLSIIEILAFINHSYLLGLISGMINAYKLTFVLILYFLLDNYIYNKYISVIELIELCIYSSIIYSIIIILSDFMGLSYGSYGDGIGSKGVFASANGLGIFIGVGCLLSLYLYEIYRKRKYLLCILLFAYVLLNLMSKAAFLSIILTVILFCYYQSASNKSLILIGTGIIIFLFKTPIIDIIENASEVIVYRWNNTSSLIEFLFSGRQNYLQNAINSYTAEGLLVYRLFIGGGYFMSFRNPDDDFSNITTSPFLEAELFDSFFMYGIIGSIVLLYIWFKAYRSLIKQKLRFKLILISILIMLFLHSSFAGHVIFNGMSVIALASMFVICFQGKKSHEGIIPVKNNIV